MGDLQLALWNGYYHAHGFLHLVVWGPDGMAVFDFYDIGSNNDVSLTHNSDFVHYMGMHAPEFFALGDSIFPNLECLVRVPNANDMEHLGISKGEMEDYANVRSLGEHGFKMLWDKGNLLGNMKQMKVFWTKPLRYVRGALIMINIVSIFSGNQTVERFKQNPPSLRHYLQRKPDVVVDEDVQVFLGINVELEEGEDE